MDFDVIPYEDITWGRRLGAGSFGSVYKGTYLGIDIAIKEVLPSTEYDVHKYFEREWRIMRECRHPNVVLFLGLSRAPEDDGRVFICSEYLPRGNLRSFILSSHPFPWRLRLSFATDVARAVAYLHARQCIHRDLKGENLLITSNERVKVTDFGFARISSRNADEMRRMTYCGTDELKPLEGYMSPEILMGNDFGLPTDVFSLGIILVEIMSRRLVDSKTYTRMAPTFTPDPEEVRRRASAGCPPALVDLAQACCQEDPLSRPRMPEILSRLREIELQVLEHLSDVDGGEHVGSVKLVQHGGKRAMPIFDQPGETTVDVKEAGDDEDEAKMEEEALMTLAGLNLDERGIAVRDVGNTWRTARWDERPSIMDESRYTDASEMREGHEHLLHHSDTTSSFDSGPALSAASAYSTEVLKGRPLSPITTSALLTATPFKLTHVDDASSVLTIKESRTGSIPDASKIGTIPSLASSSGLIEKADEEPVAVQVNGEDKAMIPTRYTGRAKALGTHRFTLVGKDAPVMNGKLVSAFTSTFAFAFLPKALTPANKCPVCHKRIGQRPALQCDDCSVTVHVNCSHAAPRNCTLDAILPQEGPIVEERAN
ncbi:hypothetical protein P7C73_g5859, partial [Tremellales sp. Uapishka_1]